jgi:DNA-binding phage protein
LYLTPKQRKAREVLLATGNHAEAAREAGVNRTTIYRWLKDPNFLAAQDSPAPEGPGLATLIPKALKLLDEALEGKKVTQAQIRAALEVVKTSKALTTPTEQEKAQSLTELIAHIDAEGGDDGD